MLFNDLSPEDKENTGDKESHFGSREAEGELGTALADRER